MKNEPAPAKAAPAARNARHREGMTRKLDAIKSDVEQIKALLEQLQPPPDARQPELPLR